ncbi:flagellar hook-associated protein FlgL [Virgibacillus sp. W0430]|uniref:flagellar hook-associated protein FlgL n=1 Tax=Virgibacillus sp. W0430 TaxID=3391580 RepID=UPI003F48FD9A
MRVTQNMLSNNMLRQLMHSQTKMDKYLEQLYTGKKIRKPSEDPVVAMKGMNYRTQVTEVEQYKRNTGEIHNWMDNSDAALDKATKAMHRLSELAVQASNSPYGSAERNSIKEEAFQLKEHLIEIANTKVNGKHIFNGTDTDQAPVDTNNGTYPQSTTPVMIEVFKDIKIQANVEPEKVFTEQLFDTVQSFIDDLENDNVANISSHIGTLNDRTADIINARADLGARMNRLELVENRLDEQEVIAKKTMSENEDVHFEEAITNLITQETLHRAALAAGSRIIQPSLLDFLR